MNRKAGLKEILAVLGGLAGALLVVRFVTYQPDSAPGDKRQVACVAEAGAAAGAEGIRCEALEAAARAYREKVEPILRPKCYDCHGMPNRFPIYAALPPAKGLVEKDIRSARHDIDMTHGFPFNSRGDLFHDLEELEEVLESGEMPPIQYKVMHWLSAPTEEEKAVIRAWIEETRDSL